MLSKSLRQPVIIEPSGRYKTSSCQVTTESRITPIQGYHEDGDVNYTKHRTWEINLSDTANHNHFIATIKNPNAGIYANVDQLDGFVTAASSPQEFDLFKTSLGYRIQVKGSTDTWVLDNGQDWTQIHVTPHPSETDVKQYWTFVPPQ